VQRTTSLDSISSVTLTHSLVQGSGGSTSWIGGGLGLALVKEITESMGGSERVTYLPNNHQQNPHSPSQIENAL